MELDLDAAQQAVGALADELGLSETDCAEGIVRVANAEMLRALRVVTVQRGIDPRRYALLCFGGAGGLHAAAIAAELGISEIVCPRASGVLAALGLVVSPRRRDVQRSVLLTGDALTADAIAQAADELAAQARDELGGDSGDDVRPHRDVRAALPRAGVRAADLRRCSTPTRRSCVSASSSCTRSATATATPSRSSSW